MDTPAYCAMDMTADVHGNARLKTVPLFPSPPFSAVPYKVPPARITSEHGDFPSLPGEKLYSVVKSPPLVLMENTVPLPPPPVQLVVPYKVLPDKINPAYGLSPSVPPVKTCRLVKLLPPVSMAN